MKYTGKETYGGEVKLTKQDCLLTERNIKSKLKEAGYESYALDKEIYIAQAEHEAHIKAGWLPPEEVEKLRTESREWGIEHGREEVQSQVEKRLLSEEGVKLSIDSIVKREVSEAVKENSERIFGMLQNDYPQEADSLRQALTEGGTKK